MLPRGCIIYGRSSDLGRRTLKVQTLGKPMLLVEVAEPEPRRIGLPVIVYAKHASFHGSGELSFFCSRNARVLRVLDGCVSNFICGVHTTQLYTSTASS